MTSHQTYFLVEARQFKKRPNLGQMLTGLQAKFFLRPGSFEKSQNLESGLKKVQLATVKGGGRGGTNETSVNPSYCAASFGWCA